MEYVLIGTAGHVDHGKSTLIKALTGIDPDRLKEEKEREMTIDIGFANFTLPGGRRVQVIDVPGHERFIKNMLTGVHTVDLILFVIDAKEGIKPQTREHFDILKLLDIKTGIIVLTKIDLVNAEQLTAVTQSIAEFVRGSFLAQAPVVKVSSVTGEGLPELVQTIDRLTPLVRKRDDHLPARLLIDRVFSMTGAGTVVTGTLVSGTVKINDLLEVLPQKTELRVRQIQSYGGKAAEAVAGQRVGLNLAGVKKEDLIRGNTLVAPGYIEPTYIFDANLEVLPDSPFPLRNNTRVRLHTGTGEFLGRIILLDKKRLEPGQPALIQFRAEVPLAVVKDDRFVIRLYAPMVTVGGGRILDPHPPKHKRFQPDITQQLEALKSATPKESVTQVLLNAGLNVVKTAEIIDKVNLPLAEIEAAITELAGRSEIVKIDSLPGQIMHRTNFRLLKEKIIRTVEDFYRKQPLKLNILIKEIKLRLVKPDAPAEFFQMAVSELLKENQVEVTGDSLRLAQRPLNLTPKQEQLKQKIESFYLTNLFAPPRLEVLAETLQVKPKAAEETITMLKELGLLVSLADEIILHKQAVAKAGELIKDYLAKHENIKAGDFVKLINSSRKYAIPLLEHLDGIKLTKRVGDVRILNQ